MFVRGIDLREVELVEEGAEGVRISYRNGEREFRGGDEGREILEGWRLQHKLLEKETGK